MAAEDQLIEEFLACRTFAVAGANRTREKYGNKVFRRLLDEGKTVYPVNPKAEAVEGHTCYDRLADLPQRPEAVSIITQPPVTERIVEECAALGIPRVWMQPGAESRAAVAFCEENGIAVISGGACILVALSLR